MSNKLQDNDSIVVPKYGDKQTSNFTIPNLKPPVSRTWRDWIQVYAIYLLAFIFWAYLLLNTFVLSVDLVLLNYLPDWLDWLVTYKFLVLLVLVLIFMAKRGAPHALFYLFYFLLFPIIQFLWVSFLVIRRRSWLLFFAFVNAILTLLSNFKRKFQVAVYMLVAGAISIASDFDPLLYCVVATSVFLATWQIIVVFLEATKPAKLVSLYLDVARFVWKADNRQIFSPDKAYEHLPVEQLTEAQLTERASRLQLSFILARGCLVFSRQLRGFHLSSWRLLPTITSVMGLITSNVFLYSFAHFSLYKIDPSQFQVSADIAYFDFFYYSFNNILFNGIEAIRAVEVGSQVLHIAQTATIFVILAIMVGSYVSMKDQTFAESLQSVSKGFENIAKEMESHIEEKFGYRSVEEALESFEEARLALLRAFLKFASPPGGETETSHGEQRQ